MENTIDKAYVEVGKVLDILGDSYKKKLPDNVRQLFEIHTNIDYDIKIDKDTKIEDINISRKALTIISILNYKYWEKDTQKKEELKKQYDKNESDYQEKINIYKQENWLKNRENNQEIKSNEENSLITQKDISIIAKIKRFFINLFYKRK